MKQRGQISICDGKKAACYKGLFLKKFSWIGYCCEISSLMSEQICETLETPVIIIL